MAHKGKKAAPRVKKAGGKHPSVSTDKHPWPYVEVLWHDATSESEWRGQENLPNVSAIVTRGWLVRTTKLCVTICATVADIDPKEGEQTTRLDVGEIITIPRGCVREITELKVTRAAKRTVALH